MNRLSTILVSLAFLAWGVVCGAALYEHVAVIPVWTQSPPDSIAFLQPPYGLRADQWWPAIHPIVLLTMVAALVACWRTKTTRRDLGIVIGGYMVVLALTGAWYVPELLALTTDPQAAIAPADWKVRADRWELLSLVRLLFMLALTALLARALVTAARESPTAAPGEVTAATADATS